MWECNREKSAKNLEKEKLTVTYLPTHTGLTPTNTWKIQKNKMISFTWITLIAHINISTVYIILQLVIHTFSKPLVCDAGANSWISGCMQRNPLNGWPVHQGANTHSHSHLVSPILSQLYPSINCIIAHKKKLKTFWMNTSQTVKWNKWSTKNC